MDVVAATGLTKEYSGVRVLDDVTLRVPAGRIIGIIGENGAGKSTLMKILSGALAPTAGQLTIAGKDVRHLTERRAQQLGIHLVPQELNLVADLNVAENIFLGQELRRGPFLNRQAMRDKARQLLDQLETPLDPDTPLRGLPLAQQQMVEIAKAVAREMKLLILDEPTTVLNPHETEVLFSLVRRLRGEGVAVLFVSHKLAEVRRLCDDVLVLRDGKVVSFGPPVDEAEMARRMVGRELKQMFPPKSMPGTEVLLRADGLEVRRGEIFGLAGLTGSGRTELAESICGLPGRPHADLAYLSEDRQGAGILRDFNVVENVTLTSWRRYGRVFTNRRRERERAAHYAAAFRLRTPSLDTRLEFLSGGNQQKVALAKALDPQPRVLFCDEPTRGIDVQARAEIYEFLHQLVADGVGCVVISSDLEELLGLCNRIAVMRNGQIAGIVEGERINEQEIMLLATGARS